MKAKDAAAGASDSAPLFGPASEDLADPAAWDAQGDKLYFGIIRSEDFVSKSKDRSGSPSIPFTVAFIAVKNSGELVDGGPARFRGILTGVTGYKKGSTSYAHRAVGLFDLQKPERDLKKKERRESSGSGEAPGSEKATEKDAPAGP